MNVYLQKFNSRDILLLKDDTKIQDTYIYYRVIAVRIEHERPLSVSFMNKRFSELFHLGLRLPENRLSLK